MTGFDAGQRGWRLHAVEAPDNDNTFQAVSVYPALCGLNPAHGWSLDMFIERRCARCEAKLAKTLAKQP